MGRPMLIIVTGLLVALGYTFMGMSGQRSAMDELSVQAANRVMAKNLSHTGIQLAITRYDNDNSWTGEVLNIENGTADITLTVTGGGSGIEISSTGQVNGSDATYTTRSFYEVAQSSGLIPTFNSALAFATNDFTIGKMQGAFSINGNAEAGSGCSDMPGVSVMRNERKQYVENNSGNPGGGGGKGKGKGKKGGGGNSKGITGNPAVEVDSDLTYDQFEETVSRLSKRAVMVEDKSDIANSSPTNPKVFVLDSGAKLNGNVTGYGIMIIRDGGRINGNFEFNGLVIFEDEDMMLGNGTADLNGSVIVGTPNSNNVNVELTGNIALQFDCNAQQFANLAAENTLDDTYTLLSTYE